jgi:hypothetical protein
MGVSYQHAVVGLVIRDRKDQAIADVPSGQFSANAASTVIVALAQTCAGSACSACRHDCPRHPAPAPPTAGAARPPDPLPAPLCPTLALPRRPLARPGGERPVLLDDPARRYCPSRNSLPQWASYTPTTPARLQTPARPTTRRCSMSQVPAVAPSCEPPEELAASARIRWRERYGCPNAHGWAGTLDAANTPKRPDPTQMPSTWRASMFPTRIMAKLPKPDARKWSREVDQLRQSDEAVSDTCPRSCAAR